MANRNDLSISVRATLNTADIPEQLKRLNAELVKTTSSIVKIPVGIDKDGKKIFSERIKQVSTLKDEYGRLYKHVVQLNKTNGLPIKGTEKIQNITDKISTLTTETHKWTDTAGNVNTWTTTVDSAGQQITTRVKESVTALGEITTETSEWGQKTVEVNGQLQSVYGQIGDTIKQVKDFTTDMTTTTTSTFGQVVDTINGVTNSYQGLITTTEKVGSNGEYLRTVVSQYTNDLGQVVIKTEQFDKANRQVATTERQVSQDIQNTSRNVKLFGMSLSDAFARLSQFYLASLPIRAVQNAITETITTVKEFDNALIEFRKVSDLAGESLDNYVKKLAQMGELTGSTVQAMVEASTEFKKSGFSEEDSAKLASVAEMYRNIADEEVSAADSASFIIAQMKAFNIEADNAQHIIDSVNEVANNFAVSSADLAENLGKVSATLAVNGVSFEEQIGMLTAITEVTRNASTSARGLSMISSRLVQVLDDSSTTGKKLTKIYNDLGIELKDENGQMRGTYEILSDLAKQWDTLSGDQQKYIALTSAGARQTQNFVALMSNFDQAVKATDTALKSQGSALKENDKVMESIEKKLQVLKSQFQQLVIDSGIQDFTKLLLDASIAILQFANTDLGKTTTAILAFEAVLVLVNNTIIKTGKTLAAQILVNQGYSVSMAEMAVANMGFAASLDVIKTKLLQSAAAFLASPFGQAAVITAAMVGVGLAIEKYNNRLDDSIDKMNEFSEQAKESENELEDFKDQLHEVKEQLKKVNEEKLKVVDKEQLKELERQSRELENQELILKRQVELAQQRYELEHKAAEEQAKKAYNTTERSSYKMQEIDPSAYGSGASADFAQVTAIEEIKLATEALKEYTEERNRLIRLADVEERNKENYTRLLKEEEEQHGKNTEKYKEYQNALEEHTQKYENYERQLESVNNEVEKAQNVGQKQAETLQAIDENLKSSDKTTQEYKEHIAEATDAYLDASNSAEETANNIYDLGIALEETDDATDDIADDFEDIEKAIDEFADALGITVSELSVLKQKFDEITLAKFLGELSQIRQKISDTNTVIDNMQDALEVASNALEEYNENGYLTIDTFQSLMGVSAQYLAALVNENGQLEINQNTLGNLVEQLKIAKIEELQEAAAMEIAANHTTDASNASANAIGNVSRIGSTIEETGNKAATAAGKVATFAQSVAKLSGVSSGDFTAKDKATLKYYEDLAKEISNIKVNTTKAGNAAKTAGRKGSSAAKSANSAAKDLNKTLEETKSKYEKVISYITKQYDRKTKELEKAKDAATKPLEAEIKALEKEKDSVLDGIEEEIDAIEKERDGIVKGIEKEIKALEKERDTIVDGVEDKIDALEDERDKFTDAIQSKIDILEDERDAFLKGIDAKIDALEEEKDKILDNIEAETTALKEQKEERQKYWDEQIDALKKANEERKDALELQEKLDALERAKNTKVKIYKEGQGFVYDVDQTKVAEAQKALDEYLSQRAYEDELERLTNLKEAELNNYTDRIDALNKFKDETQKAYESQIKDLKKYREDTSNNYKQQIDDLKNYKDKLKKNYDEQINNLKDYKDNLKKNYDTQINDLKEYKDNLKENYDAQLDDLNEYKDGLQRNYEEQIDNLNNKKDALVEAYDEEIAMYNEYKEQFEEMVNAYQNEQDRLLAEQLTGISFENDNWMTRLDNLASFVNEYNRLQAQLNTETTSASNGASMSGGGSYNPKTASVTSNQTVTNYSKPNGATNYTPLNTSASSRAKGLSSALSHQGYNGMPTNIKRYASGTSSVKDDEIAVVGENPNKEIVIGSKINNGELMSLNKGAGVVNADSSNTLASMLNQVGKFGSSGFGSGNGTLNNNINNDSLVVNGVTIEGSQINDPQTFVNGLLNLKAEALQRAYRHN